MSKKIAIFGASFGFLLTLITILFFANNIYVPDSSTYYEPARALAERFAFLKNPTSDEYMFFRTPGYPLFLAFLYAIIDNDSFVIFAQYILFLATSWVVYKIAFEIFNNKKIAQIAFAVSLFDFARLYFAQVIATETFFTFVLTAAIYFWVLFIKRGDLKSFALFCLFFSLDILVRPILLYFAPIILVFLVFRKDFIRNSIVFGLIFCVFVFGWMYRNYALSGVFDIASNKGDNAYFYKNAAIEARLNNTRFLEQKTLMENEWQEELENNSTLKYMNEMELSRHMTALTLEKIKEHPFIFASIQFKGLLPLFFDSGSTNFAVLYGLHKSGSGITGDFATMDFLSLLKRIFENHLPILLFGMIGFIYIIPLYFFFAKGLVLFCAKKELDLIRVFLAVIFLYLVYLSIGAESFSRLRVPLMPIIYLIASFGIWDFIKNRQKRIEF